MPDAVASAGRHRSLAFHGTGRGRWAESGCDCPLMGFEGAHLRMLQEDGEGVGWLSGGASGGARYGVDRAQALQVCWPGALRVLGGEGGTALRRGL